MSCVSKSHVSRHISKRELVLASHPTSLASAGSGMRYLREGLMQQVFTKDRLRHVVILRNNSFPSAMKQHTKVVREIYAPMMLSNKSMESILSLLAQRRLLSTIADDIQ